jgi:hypothetical protein
VAGPCIGGFGKSDPEDIAKRAERYNRLGANL